MSKLLVYIGEGKRFDLDQTMVALRSIEGFHNLRVGQFIGAVAEGLFGDDDVIVRIADDLETVTTDGEGTSPIELIFSLQQKLTHRLRLIDMNFSYDLEVASFASSQELFEAIMCG